MELARPVAVLEAQKALQRMADVAAEYAIGLGVGDVEPADGCHASIAEHVQRRCRPVPMKRVPENGLPRSRLASPAQSDSCIASARAAAELGG
jgi:hypothetical protein